MNYNIKPFGLLKYRSNHLSAVFLPCLELKYTDTLFVFYLILCEIYQLF